MQPVGLQDSSRGLSASRYPRIRWHMVIDPEEVAETVWHAFKVRVIPKTIRGSVLRSDHPATFSQPFRLKTTVDESNMFCRD